MPRTPMRGAVWSYADRSAFRQDGISEQVRAQIKGHGIPSLQECAMAARHSGEDEAKVPWYRKIHPAILGAGALAAALGAILALWDRLEDPPDHVEITRAEVIQQSTLSEFSATINDADPSISAEPAGSTRPSSMVFPNGRLPIDARPVADEEPADPASPVDPADTPPPEKDQPGITDEPTLTPSSPTEPASPGHQSPSSTETLTPTPTPLERTRRAPKLKTDFQAWQPPSDEWVKEVLNEPELADHSLTVAALGTLIQADVSSPEGTVLPPHKAASLLAKSLDHVEYREQGDKQDPSGWIVAVNLEVQGLRGEPLLLVWSLHGFDVPVDWAAERVAYRLTADKDRDMGSVNVWVPQLREQGTYQAALTLVHASSGATLVQMGVDLPTR